jgi:hypothetical protein
MPTSEGTTTELLQNETISENQEITHVITENIEDETTRNEDDTSSSNGYTEFTSSIAQLHSKLSLITTHKN